MPDVLVIDDDEATRYALRVVLEREGMAVSTVASGREGLDACARTPPHLVLLDLAMPGMGGLEVLDALMRTEAAPPVVVITGVGTPETAIRAVQLGAYEYLTKPLDADRVRLVARRAVELTGLHRQIDGLRHAPGAEDEPRLVGEHPAMQEVYKAIGRVTATPERTTVLIAGETGTGKELVARAIHRAGSDRQRPFVVVNCGALPEALVESELFGHERGAFTGAVERRIGKVEMAGEGTLFLDEVGTLTTTLQQRLLRLLQEREFERIGGRQLFRARCRFVVATNADLAAEVRAGRFREDLYYRLSVFPLDLPPLRERLSDLCVLLPEILRRLNPRLGRRVGGLAQGALAVLETHRWPGNVRELENVLHHAMLRTVGEIIAIEALPPYLLAGGVVRNDTRAPFEQARRDAIAQFESAYLTGLLAEAHGNVTEAARQTGMRRQSLQRLLRRHGIAADAFRGPSGLLGPQPHTSRRHDPAPAALVVADRQK